MNNLAIKVIDDNDILKGQLDLDNESNVTFEFILSDIREPEKRKISATREFTVPGTKNNNNLFMPFFTNGYSVTTFNPNKKLNAQVVQGANQLFSGSLQLTKVIETDKNTYRYNIIIYDKVIDFFNEIGEAELKGTINLSEYNHLFNIQTIENSWSNKLTKYGKEYIANVGEGYVYPLEDRAQAQMDNKLPFFESTKFRPAVYLKTYVDKVFAKYGYTYKSNFFNSEFFKRLIIPFASDNFLGADENDFFNGVQQVGNSNAEFQALQVSPLEEVLVEINSFTTPNKLQNLAALTYSNKLIKWNNDSTDPAKDPGNVYNTGSGVFTVNKAGKYTITATDEFIMKIGRGLEAAPKWKIWFDTLPYAKIELFKIVTVNGVATDKLVASSANVNFMSDYNNKPQTGLDVTSTVKPTLTYNAQLAVGDKFRVKYTVVIPKGHKRSITGNWGIVWRDDSVPNVSDYGTLKVYRSGLTKTSDKSSFNATLLDKEVGYDATAPMNNAIPENVKIKELFTSLNKLFNLYWEPTEKYKEIRIEPYEDFYEINLGGTPADDWTNKVEKNEAIEIIPMYELTANSYKFTYKSDNDWANQKYITNYDGFTYGNKNISIENDFLTNENVIQPIFSATPLTEFSYNTAAEGSIANLILPSYTTKDEKNTKSAMKPNVRLHYWGGLIDGSKWTIGNLSGTGSTYTINNKKTYTQYPYAGHFDNPFNPTIDINYGVTKQYYYKWTTITNNNLYNKYWRNYINSIINEDAHMYHCKIKLSKLDMNNFNLKNIYQVDNVYYRVNKLVYDTKTEIADVELIRAFDYNKFVPATGLYLNAGVQNTTTPTTSSPIVPYTTPTTSSSWNPISTGTTGSTTIAPYKPPFEFIPWVGNSIGTWAEPTGVYAMNNYLGSDIIEPLPVRTRFTVNSADYLPKYNTMDVSIKGNNFIPQNDLLTLTGFNNSVSDFITGPITINGNNNIIMPEVSSVAVFGNNNTVVAGVENVMVIGDNQMVTESNATYMNGSIIKDGIQVQKIDVIEGSRNEVQNPYNLYKIITNIEGGKDAIKNYGSMSSEEIIESNINFIWNS